MYTYVVIIIVIIVKIPTLQLEVIFIVTLNTLAWCIIKLTLKLALPWLKKPMDYLDFVLLQKITPSSNTSLWYFHILLVMIIFTDEHHFVIFKS